MGKVAGPGCNTFAADNDMAPLAEIERSIITRYRKRIWSKFIKAINEFKLIEDGDRIAVAVSGGKDSTLMAKLFQELHRHGKANFELEFIAMDPGYHENIKELLINNCRYLNIPIHVFESHIFKIVDDIAADYPCYMCAKMRRGALYGQAQRLNCNKLALGHHFNDVIETTLLNIFYNGSFKTMMPKLKSANYPGIELIRPLYHIEEQFIENFTRDHGLCTLNCACMVAAERTANKRYEVKELIEDLKKRYKNADKMIMQTARNVNLDCILGWQKDGKRYSFLDCYDDE